MLCDNKNLKFLVFAYHRSMMNGLQQTLIEHDVKFVRIDGDTKPSERQLYVQQFQSDPDTRVAILSILAAGVVSLVLDIYVSMEENDDKFFSCFFFLFCFFFDLPKLVEYSLRILEIRVQAPVATDIW